MEALRKESTESQAIAERNMNIMFEKMKVENGVSGPSTLGQVLTTVPGIIGAVSTVGKSCSIF